MMNAQDGQAHPIEKEPENIVEGAEQAEVEATVSLAQHSDHPAIRTLAILSEISDQPPAFTLASVAGLAGLLFGNKRLAQAGLRSVAALGAATATKAVVKASVTRTRPFVLRDHGHYDRRTGGPNDGPWNSFPSGHTANAFAGGRAISRVYPQATVPLMVAATAIAAVQVPRGSHYPSDLLGGIVVGLLTEAAVNRVWPKAVGEDEDDAKITPRSRNLA